MLLQGLLGCALVVVTTVIHAGGMSAALRWLDMVGMDDLKLIAPRLELAGVGPVARSVVRARHVFAEKGLVVFDGVVKGTPSHAAHPNPDNAIYNTVPVLEWFRDYRFPKVSDVLGEVKVTVSQIQGGVQHNAVPAQVELVVDVRVNDCYSNQEVAEILSREAPCQLHARSLRLNSSSISPEHPLVRAGVAMGRKTYGSPTLSDQAALSCPSLKMGPGKSTRSHSADEYVCLQEIREGIALYGELLNRFLKPDGFVVN